MKSIIIFISVFIYSTTLYSKNEIIKFYSDEIAIEYDLSVLIKHKVKKNDKSVSSFFKKLEDTKYESLISELVKVKSELNLNDWLYYELIQNLSETIASCEKNNYRTLFNAFILAKSGYDVRICYDKQIDIYIYTKDEIYLSNRFYKSKKNFYNLTYFENPELERNRELDLSNVVLNKNGIPFSFQIIELPHFKSPIVIEKDISFNNKNYKIRINKTIVELFKDYPQLQTASYFKVPLSNEAYSSFIPYFKKDLEALDTIQTIRKILSFVRLQNEYKDDMNTFKKEKPMIPEEVLFYDYADCEDKSALFYYLVNELVGIPMIILSYPNHINVAVMLNRELGDPIIYNENNYYVCEPSAIFDNTDIGYSKKSEKYTPKIIDIFTQ